MKSVSFSHLKILLVEMVRVVSYLSDLVTDLGIFRIVVPGNQIWILLLLLVRIRPVKNTAVNNFLVL